MKPAELPFLVVHARVAWPIAVVLLTALVAAAWFMLRARYRSWSTSSRARWRIGLTEAVAEGPRMLRGILFGSEAQGYWVDCAGVHVDVAGKLEVLEGSVASRDAQGLLEGDRVIVQGAVRRDGERWIVEPPVTNEPSAWWRGESAENAPVRRAEAISAWAERPPVPPSTRTSRIIAVIASAGVAYGGLRLIGRFASQSLQHAHHFEEPSAFGALSLATVVRATRADALTDYSERLRRSYDYTETEVRYQLALAELQGSCDDEVEILIAAGFWEQAREQAQHCGNQDLRMKTALLTGHFEDIGEHARPFWRGFVAIARQDWATASRVADAIAAPHPDPRTSCLREYLRMKAGQTFDRTAMMQCDVIRAIEGASSIDVVRTTSFDVLHDVATGCTADWTPSFNFNVVDLDNMYNDDGNVWLGAVCSPSSSISSLTFRTHTALVLGDTAKIAAELDAAASAATGRQRSAIEALRGLVQLRSDADMPYDPNIDEDVSGHAAALRSGERIETQGRDFDILRAAENGDGGPLAEALLRGGPTDAYQLDLIGVLPRIRTHRPDVLRALRIRWYSTEYDSVTSPFAASRYAGFERDIARLAGDAEAQQRWQAIVDAHARVYTNKDVLLALLVWQDLLVRAR